MCLLFAVALDSIVNDETGDDGSPTGLSESCGGSSIESSETSSSVFFSPFNAKFTNAVAALPPEAVIPDVVLLELFS